MATSTEAPLRLHALNLDELNETFETAHPSDILAWAIANIPSGLVQASAFNVDDIAITDILYRQLKPITPVPVLFLDTLYHFPATLETVARAKNAYNLNLQIYKIPGVMTREDFESEYGEALWERDVREFHRLTKIEPLHRGLAELDAQAWITGRRRDQAMTRTRLEIFEVDAHQRLKINPIATWTDQDVDEYIATNDIIVNPLTA
jgi:phosphoadenosine phosphosulfate reductase